MLGFLKVSLMVLHFSYYVFADFEDDGFDDITVYADDITVYFK